MYLSVQEQEEANSEFDLRHDSLFACLNCDLYLFVQVQDEVKESSVRSRCP